MNEEINRRLREAAEAHEPDRARILARVERGLAVRHRTRSITRSGPRAAIAALIAAATLATGGLAVAAIGGVPSSPAPRPTPAVPSPTVTPTPTPSARPTSSPAPTTTPPSSRPTPPADSRVQNGPLWSEGSIDADSNIYWAQSNLILKTTQPLTALTVELRIAQTGGVQKTGNWQTLPNDDFTVTVEESGGALRYRWTLKPGRTAPAGQHQFAAQYNHATGVRAGKRDNYHVHAQSSAGSSTVWGGFTQPR
ncbi:hypothetical protein GCM10029976_046880 [Kribbella albertanoniae]|uniref:Uncharacterized protein n=1 Tax=Kribbella albertanoniae TaxID=1266829 RepID=A0A4R4Q4R4_9ACTN|nr:hypothetical protein [Kribbella albertanoniae]TDC29823.1 hypothetical protein E1261_14920 [Kribbella albertanoniae]